MSSTPMGSSSSTSPAFWNTSAPRPGSGLNSSHSGIYRYGGSSANLNELTIISTDLSRPAILAEIAPGQYNLIDGHHRAARARREGIDNILAYRVPCPEHVTFLTSTRAYITYIEYWNSKVDELIAARLRRARRSAQPACGRRRLLPQGEHGTG